MYLKITWSKKYQNVRNRHTVSPRSTRCFRCTIGRGPNELRAPDRWRRYTTYISRRIVTFGKKKKNPSTKMSRQHARYGFFFFNVR